MPYHHGVETIELNSGQGVVNEVRTAAIALVGTAPEGDRQAITLVRSKADIAQFGKQLDGFTIPQALDAIFKQGGGLVAVINVTDDTHFVDNDTVTITDEVVTLASGTGQLEFAFKPATTPVVKSMDGLTTYVSPTNYTIAADGTITAVTLIDGTYKVTYQTYEQVTVTDMAFASEYAPKASTVVVKSADLVTTYVIDTHYTFDEFGNFSVVLGGGITEGDALQLIYERFDAAQVAGADIVGSYDSGTEVRTGLYLLELCYNTYGFKPKVIIAPGFTTNATVWPELIARAEEFRAVTLFDSAAGWTNAQAIAGRGPLSTSNFGTGSGRVILCYPGVVVVHPDTEENEVRPMSQFVAGLISSVDDAEGHWTSPSNHELLGILELETDVTWDFQNTSTQANALNEVGICTMGKPFGSGWCFWGNRFAKYPASTAVDNFIPVRRVADILHESVELAMLPFIDKPITNAVIASIKETVNSYMRSLVQRGALISGDCFFDPAKNPPASIALGQLTFDLDFMPPTPAERITFESFININRLSVLGA